MGKTIKLLKSTFKQQKGVSLTYLHKLFLVMDKITQGYVHPEDKIRAHMQSSFWMPHHLHALQHCQACFNTLKILLPCMTDVGNIMKPYTPVQKTNGKASVGGFSCLFFFFLLNEIMHYCFDNQALQTFGTPSPHIGEVTVRVLPRCWNVFFPLSYWTFSILQFSTYPFQSRNYIKLLEVTKMKLEN